MWEPHLTVALKVVWLLVGLMILFSPFFNAFQGLANGFREHQIRDCQVPVRSQ